LWSCRRDPDSSGCSLSSRGIGGGLPPSEELRLHSAADGSAITAAAAGDISARFSFSVRATGPFRRRSLYLFHTKRNALLLQAPSNSPAVQWLLFLSPSSARQWSRVAGAPPPDGPLSSSIATPGPAFLVVRLFIPANHLRSRSFHCPGNR
jgi:hypothetical protein